MTSVIGALCQTFLKLMSAKTVVIRYVKRVMVKLYRIVKAKADYVD